MNNRKEDRENQTLVLALLRSHQAFHRAIGPVFRAAGLTESQWDALETLSNKGALTVNELMRLTLGTSGNLDVVIKNLMQAGLVEKTVDETDRRARVLRLTLAGRQKVDDFMPTHNRALGQIFGRLDPGEKRDTIKMLNRLRKMLPLYRNDKP